jgi:hypothetical protein
MTISRLVIPVIALAMYNLGCESRSRQSACIDGASVACSCADGSMGSQLCTAGSYGTCQCTPVRPAVCGDGVCESGETCTSCHDDCGDCPACNAAPSCTNADGVPTSPSHRADLDVGNGEAPDGGLSTVDSADCKAPQLRLRVASVQVTKGGGQIYCIVNADDGTKSEVAITTKTKDLGDGDSNFFDPGVGTFWGQKQRQTSTNTLTITYDCWKVGSDAWANVLMAMSNAAMQAGGIAGPYGWAFGAGAVAASAAAAAAAAASGDDHRFNVQQTIDRSQLLDLTNGRTWDVRQSGGCGLFCSWDWTITVESWGCADTRAPGPG